MFEAEQQISRSHEEVQEVMEALEELALSYDGKDKIIETLETEKQSLTKELDMLQVNKETPPTQTTPTFLLV